MHALKDDPRVEYAEPNMIGEFTTVTPSDQFYSEQTQLSQKLQMPQAWEKTTGSSNVIIAVPDTGIYLMHDDLMGNLWQNVADPPGNGDQDGNGYLDDYQGWDFVNGDNNPSPIKSHGTQVAGVIGAEATVLPPGFVGYGIAGINWNARLMNLRIGDQGIGNGPTIARATAAIDYAVNKGANIINMSVEFGCSQSTGCSQTLDNAIKRAGDRDVLVIAAAGNSDLNMDAPNFAGYAPIKYDLPNIIGVAATDQFDNRAVFSNGIDKSNWGAVSVDVAAPGVDIWTDIPATNTYDDFDLPYDSISSGFEGTSAAAPHVAGLAGLIKALSPNIPFELIKARILDATSLDQVYDFRPTGPNPIVTGGRINAWETLKNYDPNSPAQVTTLAAVDQTSSSVTLTWHDTGDDGMTGPVTLIKLRFSKAPITASNWLLATPLEPGIVPGNPGTLHTQVVYNLQKGKTYYFALREYDEWGNGPLSNVVSRTTCGMTQNSFCKYIEIRCWATGCHSSGCFYYGNCAEDLTCILADEACPPGTCSVDCPN